MNVIDELNELARARAAELPDCSGARSNRANFRDAVRGRDRVHIVPEFKRASPSQGLLSEGADPVEQARLYEAGGASAMSILTEPTRFLGSYEDFERVAAATSLPLIQKDFIVDERQIAHAAHLGASAVLLIVRSLDDATLHEFARSALDRDLTPLIECHDAAELDRARALDSSLGGCVLGVNARDLSNLSIDRKACLELCREVSQEHVLLAESGMLEPADLRATLGIADGCLVGTALMQSPDPVAFMRDSLA